MLELIAQTSQPTPSLATLYKALIGAMIGGLIAVGVDLHSYGQSAPGAAWNWKLTAAHAGYGIIAGGLGAIGISITGTI